MATFPPNRVAEVAAGTCGRGELDRLSPRPAELTDSGARVEIADIRAGRLSPTVVGLASVIDAAIPGSRPAHPAGRLVVDVRTGPTGGPAESYELTVRTAADGARAEVRAADPAGSQYGVRTLLAAIQAVSNGGTVRVPVIEVRDAPELPWRGIVEGFYGPPWSHADRLAQLDFAARHKLNTYVYAPKDDPFHRARWREPYPQPDLRRLAELAAAAADRQIRFVVALAPGLSMRYAEADDLARLVDKAALLRQVGVRHIALLFDDIPGFRTDDRALGLAHGRVGAAVVDAGPESGPLLVCPADYAGTAPSAYRAGLAANLPADTIITWSGPGVVSAEVTADDVAEAMRTYGRRVLLWDNVPVNDFDRARIYLGPLRQRPAASALVGLLANPMIEAAPSRITLATAADYAWRPSRYQPKDSVGRALALEAAPDADRLGPLVLACSGWPPDADADRELTRAQLTQLATVSGRPESELARAVEPWRQAGADMARAALAARDLQATSAPTPGALARVRADLDRAERHWPNVLRDGVSPFVRSVLHRLAPRPVDDPGRPYAVLVGGEVPTAGEERLADRLRRHGLSVRSSVDPGAAPELMIVSRSASVAQAEAVALGPYPLLGLFRLVELGLADRTGVLLREERVRIVAPGDPFAGGRSGAVTVHRGPAMSRWCEPGREGIVVARAEEEDRPVIVHYPRGARLANGSIAPAPRAALFLGRDLLAPWVATPDADALVDAAIAALTVPAAV